MPEQYENPEEKETKEAEIPVSAPEVDAAELPGASAENAILITDEQAKALSEAIAPDLVEREIEVDPVLAEAANAILDAYYAGVPDSHRKHYSNNALLWVRTENSQRDPYGDVDYNTWQIWIGDDRYGEGTDTKYFTHPDGTVEEVDRVEPIRGSFNI
jgi:hypothetical protein